MPQMHQLSCPVQPQPLKQRCPRSSQRPRQCHRAALIRVRVLQIFCLFGADKDTDLSYTYDVEAFTTDTPSSPSKVCQCGAGLCLAVSRPSPSYSSSRNVLHFDRTADLWLSRYGRVCIAKQLCDLQIELGPGDGTVNKRSLEACSQLGPRVCVQSCLMPC